jgi:hypothetical protein
MRAGHAGRISASYPDSYYTYSTGNTESAFQALAMTGSDVTLVIGGDYSADASNPYNLYYRTVNARYASAAVRFSGDATVSFNAQAGAALASANADANQRFGVSAYTTYTRGAIYNSDTPGVTDASATVFDAVRQGIRIDSRCRVICFLELGRGMGIAFCSTSDEFQNCSTRCLPDLM